MDTFVAIGSANPAITSSEVSEDGTVWNTGGVLEVRDWRAVAWSGSVFCAVAAGVGGSDTTTCALSVDGKIWTYPLMPQAAEWTDITWNGALFCAISGNVFGSTIAATSPDGITWTARTLPATALWGAVAWNGSVFCAVGDITNAATSPDGITWTLRTLPDSLHYTAIAWNGSVFCATAYNSSVAATSPDGITWTPRALPSSGIWIGITWNGSVFCAVSRATAGAATSPDGITWTARTLPITGYWDSMKWNGFVFCAVAAGGECVTSPDGITWTQRTFPTGYSRLGTTGFINLSLVQADTTALVFITSFNSASSNTIASGATPTLAVSTSGNSAAVGIGAAVPIRKSFLGVSETGAFSSTAAAPTIFWVVVSESATATSSTSGIRILEASVTVLTTLNGAVVGSATYSVSGSSVAEVLSAAAFVRDFWDGWVTNLNTNAVSFYEDFKFNSFAMLNGVYYGCNDAGIYSLTGDTDGGVDIAAVATTSTSDLSTEQILRDMLKTVPYAYISASSGEPFLITCRVEGVERTYEFRVSASDTKTVRADLGKGAKGTFWQFEVRNQNGADFEIVSISPAPVNSNRRI